MSYTHQFGAVTLHSKLNLIQHVLKLLLNMALQANAKFQKTRHEHMKAGVTLGSQLKSQYEHIK